MEKELETQEIESKFKLFVKNLFLPKTEIKAAEILAADPSAGVKPADVSTGDTAVPTPVVGDDLPDGDYLGKDGNVYTVAKGKITALAPMDQTVGMAETKPEATKVTETKVTEVKASEITDPNKEFRESIELKLSEISKKITSSGIKVDPDPTLEKPKYLKDMKASERIAYEVELARKNQ